MKLKTILLATLVVSAAGCQTQSYLINGGGGSQAVDKMQPFFVSGIGQTQAEDAAAACDGASKVARIDTQQTFLNGFLHGLTYGIYSPRQIRVYCK